jgi:hypothetical protein
MRRGSILRRLGDGVFGVGGSTGYLLVKGSDGEVVMELYIQKSCGSAAADICQLYHIAWWEAQTCFLFFPL